MGRVYPLNDNHHYASASVAAPCASHFFPALSALTPAGGFRETSTGLDTTPIGICVNLRSTPSPHTDTRQLLDGLIEEIRLRSGSRKKRPVHYLHLRLPTRVFETADITELVYHLSRHFRLAHQGVHHFCAQISSSQASTSMLALLRGLGFNQLRLDADQPMTAAALAALLQEAHDYHFQQITLAVSDPACPGVDSLEALARRSAKGPHLQHMQLDFPPLSWSEKPQQAEAEARLFQHLFNYFRQEGYRVLGNDCFVVPDHPLARGQLDGSLRRTPLGYNADGIDDICGLGPGALTRENHHYYRNLPSVQGYLQRVMLRQSPIAHAHTVSYRQRLMDIVIDQLLCFHRLDLDYLRSRYQIDTPALLKALSTGVSTCQPASPWWHCAHHHLSLSPEGILNLHHLCRLVDASTGAAFPALNSQR